MKSQRAQAIRWWHCSNIVILVHRPDAWQADDRRAGEADLIIAEHRNGPITIVAVAHQLHYSRFADVAV